MKKIITITTLMSLLVTTVLLPAGCQQEPEETEPVASESNRWLELLSALPENEVALKAAFLQDNAYLEEKKHLEIAPRLTAMKSGKRPLGSLLPMLTRGYTPVSFL